MSSQVALRGLSGTSEQGETLQQTLVSQFGRLHIAEMLEAFLGQVVSEGTTAREDGDGERREGRQTPLLWHISEEQAQRAVALQKWEGMVTAIQGDSFIARLRDLSMDVPEEEVELFLRDVSEDDKALIELGAIFYWSIGYETMASGQIKRTSVIKFRRLPAWTAQELRVVKKQAADIRRAIGWGEQNVTARTG